MLSTIHILCCTVGYNIELVVRKDSLKDIKHLVQTKLPG